MSFLSWWSQSSTALKIRNLNFININNGKSPFTHLFKRSKSFFSFVFAINLAVSEVSKNIPGFDNVDHNQALKQELLELSTCKPGSAICTFNQNSLFTYRSHFCTSIKPMIHRLIHCLIKWHMQINNELKRIQMYILKLCLYRCIFCIYLSVNDRLNTH